jgi:hypothetical protein
LRTFRQDLAGALVSTEADVLTAIPDQVVPASASQSGLISRALADVDMGRPGAIEAARLLSQGRRPATVASYAGKFDRFFSFCVQVQIERGFAPLCPMPASESTVLLYLGWLFHEGRVHAASLQPYLSAINQMHIDFGFPAPALGHDVRLARRAFGNEEGASTLETTRRGAFPASAVFKILHLGLMTSCPHTLRRCACIVTQFVWFCRGDTSMLLRRAHISLRAEGICINERTKTISRHHAAPTLRESDSSTDAGSLVLRLLLRWELEHPHAPEDLFWSLKTDTYSASAWSSSLVSLWLQELTAILGILPPAGVSWSSHALRSGGASSAFAVGVQPLVIARFGCWKTQEMLMTYVDVLVKPDAAARLFFGHLRTGTETVTADSLSVYSWGNRLCAAPSLLPPGPVTVTLLKTLAVLQAPCDDLVQSREPSIASLVARLT